MNVDDYIRIFDTTLRDGEQTPGVSLTPEEKLEIALQLDKLGVDVIEAGFPSASEGEQRAVKDLVRAGLRAEVCALTRTLRSDIDAALNCDVDLIHTFISTSEVQMKYALNMTPDQVLEAAVDAVQYIKDHGVSCEFSPMDATRTDINFLKEICIAVEEAGADRINIPDTVGIMTPRSMRELISELREVVKVPLSVHCHDDFGMAVANSLAGVEGGASQVHVTVNGLGERAGNAALEEVVVALKLLYNIDTSVRLNLLYNTSRLVSRITGISVQPNKAIVGENAFVHESGIHTHAILSQPLTYEPIPPELVGRRRRLVAGKHAGSRGIKAALNEMGLNPNDEQLKEIFLRVKALGDKGKRVTDADLRAIAESVMELPKIRPLKLEELTVVTGDRVTPTASVRLNLNGKILTEAATGVGPVDAAINAVRKAVSAVEPIRLEEYHVNAITGGTDALVEVIVRLSKGDKTITAMGAHEDIVMASVEAMLNGMNLLMMMNHGNRLKRT